MPANRYAMPDAATQSCPDHDAVEALARDTLPEGRCRRVQRHLEHCPSCRTAFRALTADRFPRLRGYTVIAQIGAGAYGSVYQAVHHAMERTEALKVLHAETRFCTASFENEVQLIAQLQHPNIATLFDAHLGTPPVYYAMEFVEGRPLDEYLRSVEVSVADRIEILRRVALAMDYAHQQGVVHLDLKPQNILIDPAGQPRIVDFGIARKLALADTESTAARTAPHHPEGTSGYIAPEEIAGRSVDGRADVYALGVLLCQGLTGKPWTAETGLTGLAATLRRRRIGHAGDLAAVISRCIQEEPDRRYPTCAALAQDLGDYLAAGPVSAWPHHTIGYRAGRRATREFRSHPRLVYWGLVFLMAAALFYTFRKALAPRDAPGAAHTPVVLVAFEPSTVDAIRQGHIGADLDGLAVQHRKSWRMLYGKMMQALAQVSPRAVIWDYYFPDCHPEFDEVFLRGLDALQSEGTPVVVGCRDFGVDGEPLGCQHILGKAHACGALYVVSPDTARYELYVPICIQRGLAAPIPTLVAVGFAGARYPECELDLRIENTQVHACYRRRHYAKGESAWRSEVDEFPVAHREPDRESRVLEPGDEVLTTLVAQPAPGEWDGRIIPFEDVLTASTHELESWLAGRAVVVGQMLPGQDVFRTLRGTEVYGCEIHAQGLDAFLAGAYSRRFPDWGLSLRILLWCLLAGAIVPMMPVGRYGATRATKLICLGLFLVGLTAAPTCLPALSSHWSIEVALAACATIVAGSVLYLCTATQVRLARIAPGPGWPTARDIESADSTG